MEMKSQHTPLTHAETASFCNQMAMILRSGISAVEGLQIMLEDAEGADEKALLQDMYDTFLSSGSFASTLEETGAFPKYMLHMVQIGEQAGKMEEVMTSLALYYEREDAIAKSVRSAVTYPLIMITMMLLVVLVLITKVLPIFNQVFAQLGREMTGFSKGLLSLGNAINRYSVFLVAILAVLFGAVFFFTRTEKGRRVFTSVGAKMKISRRLYDKMAACQFAGGMALTLSSGLTQEESIEMARSLTDNPVFLKKLDQFQADLKDGLPVSEALTKNHIFSGLYARMITIGVRTGSMDEVMQKIAGQYEEEIDSQLSSMISVLEPTLVAVLSIIVGMVLLSVMLPLMGILAGL